MLLRVVLTLCKGVDKGGWGGGGGGLGLPYVRMCMYTFNVFNSCVFLRWRGSDFGINNLSFQNML